MLDSALPTSVLPENWPNRDYSQFVETGGLNWHIQIRGEGPDMLLIHGTGASAHSWHRMAPFLEGYRLVMMDLPGQGFTSALPGNSGIDAMADGLTALIDALDVKPEAVIGHSAGAALALRLALDGAIPEACHLVGINAALKPYGGLAYFLFSPFAKLLSLTPMVARMTARQAADPGAVERFMDATGSILEDSDIVHYRRLFSNPDHVAATLKMMADWNLAPLLRDARALGQPLHLLAGRDDGTVSYRVSERVARDLPNTSLRLFEDAGHLMHEETPDAVAEVILEQCQKKITLDM